MKYNSKQLECIKHPTSPLMILAGAGTGKTTTIVGRIADYIQSRKMDPKSITNNAIHRCFNFNVRTNYIINTFYNI